VLALAELFGPAAAAHALSSGVSCTGTETAGYNPGLSLSSHTTNVSVNGILEACASSDPTVTSGSYTQHFSAALSCTTLFAGLDASRVLQWSNDRTSTFNYTRTLNNVGGQTTVTFTGVITAGEFAGDTAVQQVVFATPDAQACLTTAGLTQLGPGVSVLTVDEV
jgi:hypothetical protein